MRDDEILRFVLFWSSVGFLLGVVVGAAVTRG